MFLHFCPAAPHLLAKRKIRKNEKKIVKKSFFSHFYQNCCFNCEFGNLFFAVKLGFQNNIKKFFIPFGILAAETVLLQILKQCCF